MFTDRTTTFRRRLGAASIVGATLLFTAAELLFPTEGDNPADEIAGNAAHHGQLLAAVFCYLFASVLFIPAFFALMNPVRGRGTVLTHLGGGLALLGNALSGLALAGVQFITYEASAPGVDRTAVSAFIDKATHDPVGLPLVLGHELFTLGIVLLAMGLYRARAGYRWAALCLGLAPLVDAVLGTIGFESGGVGAIVVPLLSDGLLVAGAVGLGWWQLTTTGASWEGQQISAQPAPESAAIPA